MKKYTTKEIREKAKAVRDAEKRRWKAVKACDAWHRKHFIPALKALEKCGGMAHCKPDNSKENGGDWCLLEIEPTPEPPGSSGFTWSWAPAPNGPPIQEEVGQRLYRAMRDEQPLTDERVDATDEFRCCLTGYLHMDPTTRPVYSGQTLRVIINRRVYNMEVTQRKHYLEWCIVSKPEQKIEERVI